MSILLVIPSYNISLVLHLQLRRILSSIVTRMVPLPAKHNSKKLKDWDQKHMNKQ